MATSKDFQASCTGPPVSAGLSCPEEKEVLGFRALHDGTLPIGGCCALDGAALHAPHHLAELRSREKPTSALASSDSKVCFQC